MICSNQALLRDQLEKLSYIFIKNGYPRQLFERISVEYLDKKQKQKLEKKNNNQQQTLEHSQSEPEDKTKPFRPLLKIPFVGKSSTLFSRRIMRLIKSQYNIDARIIYQTTKVKDYFRLKDKSPTEISSKVVYKFTCSSDSNTEYIGYMTRSLSERVQEHVRGGTAISDHITVCDSCNTNGVGIKNFKVIKRCRNAYDTSVYEAMLIKRQNPALNRQLVKPRKGFTLQVF